MAYEAELIKLLQGVLDKLETARAMVRGDRESIREIEGALSQLRPLIVRLLSR